MRFAALGQITSRAVHDLRNPLGAIRNACYFLRRKVPEDQPKWQEYLALIDREVGGCVQVINNLMEMVRPREPVRAWIDVAALARAVVAGIAVRPGVTVDFRFSPEPLMARADPDQFRQAVTNLVKNALEAMRTSGTLTLEGTVVDDRVRLVVADTGPGVSAEDRANLFQPLFTTKPKGTGLGLWITRQLLERQGGTVRLLEDRGPGAAFVIELPTESPPST